MTRTRVGQVIAAALLGVGLTGCNTEPMAADPPRPAPSAALTQTVVPDAELYRSYIRMNATYERLWKRGAGARVATARTNTIRGFPYLVLEARGSQSRPDFYAYFPKPGGGQTQEFGAFFDRNRDGRTDWLVFNGGSAIAEGMKFIWWTHHAIDRNHDGKFDVLVIDAVDRDGNGLTEPGVSAWLFDDNFDGRLDRGAFMSHGRSMPMRVAGGRLDWKLLTHRPGPLAGRPFTQLFDMIARDIDRLR